MPRKQLANMDPAVAKRVIRLMFSRAGLKQDIGAIHLKQLLAAIDKPESTITEFPKGYTAEVSGDRVYFKAPNKETKTEKPRFKIKECKVISITEAPPLRTLDKNTCVLDAEKLLDFDGDIVLRSRKPGDRIRPIGLGGSKKLQDYLTDAKIPKEERNKIACLACGHEVLWVQGRAVSELCKVDGQTEYMLITQIQEDQ
jgi:tRNA(Ile)-lysidine synthase